MGLFIINLNRKLIMSLKLYILMDVYDSLEDLNNMVLYLCLGVYIDEIVY